MGEGRDFSQPPAWAQDFSQKHIHTHLHPYLLCKPLVCYSLADTMTPFCPHLGHPEGTTDITPFPDVENSSQKQPAAWGPLPSLLPLGRAGTDLSLDPCLAANSRSESVSPSVKWGQRFHFSAQEIPSPSLIAVLSPAIPGPYAGSLSPLCSPTGLCPLTHPGPVLAWCSSLTDYQRLSPSTGARNCRING